MFSTSRDPERHFVVTGAGRCGTHWFQDALQTQLGVPTGHEGVFAPWTDGTFLDWRGLRGDCAWPAVAYLRGEVPRAAAVVHLVRDPLAMVRSRLGGNKLGDSAQARDVRDFVAQVRPDVFRDAADDVGRAILFVSRWDAWCAQLLDDLDYRHRCVRIEDVSVSAELFRDVVGFLVDRTIDLDEAQAVLDRMSPDIGRHPRAAIEWDDIVRHPNGPELEAMAERHGYPTG